MDFAKTGRGASCISKFSVVLLLSIFLIGTWARFKELEWHFTSVDDRGVAEIIFKNRTSAEPEAFPISSFYTYAPFQFLFTPLLIKEGLPYRELLWRGRFPSAASGVIAMAAFLWFYFILHGRRWHRMIIPFALLAFSWENIIYAKQMHNYAIGVFASVLLLILMLINLKRPDAGPGRMLLNAFILALASHMQYQILSMVPAFFICYFLYMWKRAEKKIPLTAAFALSGAVYFALVFPMYFFLLKKHMEINAGAPGWAHGLHGEFLFSPDAAMNLLEKARYALLFYVENFYVVLQSNTAFFSETHPLFEPFGIAVFMLFIFGILSLAGNGSVEKRYLGIFTGLIFIIWFALVYKNKLTLSPTRHALVFLPFMTLLIGEGFFYPFEKLKPGGTGSGERPAAVIGLALTILFLLSYGVFLEERRDPFVEAEIVEALERYDVDAIGTNVRTDGLFLMPEIAAYKKKVESDPSRDHSTLAWISRWDVGFDKTTCEEMRKKYNEMQLDSARKTGTLHQTIDYPCSSFDLIYSKKHESNLQVDYSRRTQIPMYTNSFYFYIVSRDPAVLEKARNNQA